MMCRRKYVPPGTCTAREAAEMLGCTHYRVTQMALAGEIKIKCVPGFSMLFLRESVEKRAAELNPPKRRRTRPVAAGK